jgi:ornithine cyclodeaminase/alanine dehydrogenase-like protein (mu-crystallin family)
VDVTTHTETLLLSESDVQRLVNYRDAVVLAEELLAEQGRGNVEMPPKQLVNLRKYGHQSYTNAMPAYLHYLGTVGIKWGGGFAANIREQHLPFMVQTLILNDPETGVPLAIMGASYLTSLKTGAETLVAGRHLARKDAPLVVTIVGVGSQGQGSALSWLAAHELGRVRVAELRLNDLYPEVAKRFAAQLESGASVPVHAVADLRSAVTGADVVVTATHAEKPIIDREWTGRGVLFASLGSYPELDPEISLTADKLVVDNWEQNEHRGEFQELLATGRLTRTRFHGELPDIVAGRLPGRQRDDEVIVASLIGLGSVDLSFAHQAYLRARAQGVGARFSFV